MQRAGGGGGVRSTKRDNGLEDNPKKTRVLIG